MSLHDVAQLIDMNGYGAYVWGAVAAVLLTLVAELATLAIRDRDSAARGTNLPEETTR